MPLSEAQAFFNLDEQANVIEVYVDDPEHMDLMRDRILDINSECQVTLLYDFLGIENVNDLVPADVDYVIDCIDSLSCKVALVVESYKRGLKVASSMGAGNRLDGVLTQSQRIGCRLLRSELLSGGHGIGLVMLAFGAKA